MSNGNQSIEAAAGSAKDAPAKAESEKAPKALRYVVLTDNHTHEKIKRQRGEVIEFRDDRIPSKYPKIFALEDSQAAKKVIAEVEAAAKQEATEAAKLESEREAAESEAAASATKH